MVAKHEAYLPWSKAGRPSELKWYCVTFLLDGCFISSILACSFCKVLTVAVCDVAAAPSNNTKRRSFVHAHRGQCPPSPPPLPNPCLQHTHVLRVSNMMAKLQPTRQGAEVRPGLGGQTPVPSAKMSTMPLFSLKV